MERKRKDRLLSSIGLILAIGGSGAAQLLTMMESYGQETKSLEEFSIPETAFDPDFDYNNYVEIDEESFIDVETIGGRLRSVYEIAYEQKKRSGKEAEKYPQAKKRIEAIRKILKQISQTPEGQALLKRALEVQGKKPIIQETAAIALKDSDKNTFTRSHWDPDGFVKINWSEWSRSYYTTGDGVKNPFSLQRIILHELTHAADAISKDALNTGFETEEAFDLFSSARHVGTIRFVDDFMERYFGEPRRKVYEKERIGRFSERREPYIHDEICLPDTEIEDPETTLPTKSRNR